MMRILAAFERPGLARDSLELILVALAFLLYFIVRANVIDRPDLALANAGHILDVEKALGFNWEHSWQQAIINDRVIVRFFNFVYFWLDFPLIATLGLLLYFRRRPDYTFTRDALLASGALALISYAIFPVAPPRLNPEAGLVDTLRVLDNLSYQAQSTQFFVNPYAAMPSLHVGWAFLLAIGVYRAFPRNRLVLVLVIVHPFTQWASTIFTGNHYILDGFGGLFVAALGLGAATFMQRRGYSLLRQRLGLVSGDSSKRGEVHRAGAPPLN